MHLSKARQYAGAAVCAVTAVASAAVFAPVAAADPGSCDTVTDTIKIFHFNDFHGRIQKAPALFTLVEQVRVSLGEDHVLLVSAGDNIGGSTFESMVQNDKPSSDTLKAAGVDAIAAGNHEFDRGFADLANRINNEDFGGPGTIVAANVYNKGTTTVAAPLVEYKLLDRGGITIGFVGAVTGDLPSLVSPAGIAELTIGDPVAAVNRVAAQLSDGDNSNGEADVVIASFHEGAPDPSVGPEANAQASPNFANIYHNISADVDMVFNGHTHQLYNWTMPDGTTPLMQADHYAKTLAVVELDVDAVNKGICEMRRMIWDAPEEGDLSLARIHDISDIVTDAVAKAEEVGNVVIGKAEKAISTAGEGGAGTRNEESPMVNLVAQMFHDQIAADNDEFIGIQNPGGSRSSFAAGDITYAAANRVLPFGNSLFTTELTGAQFKQVLEEQWQRDENGEVPSRPFLQLGLSNNVSYTYDESLPEGKRITSISINGKPIDPAKTYTVGSGSFLISGGDNFRTVAEGANTRDTGKYDLSAWVDFIKQAGTLSPDYTKRGVSVPQWAKKAKAGGDAVSYTFGKTIENAVAPQSLDMMLAETGAAVSPRLANTTITAYIGETKVGEGTVAAGVGKIDVKVPASMAAGEYLVRFVVAESGTEIFLPLQVEAAAVQQKPAPPETGV
ncbi:MAG: bifunctional metallophosphatase/5'-nucleotidase [Propionibacterium sp.]|nr:MAG: bifunctional metallophosphatase/5'-nucleotidase [Propionibacterium sp.]